MGRVVGTIRPRPGKPQWVRSVAACGGGHPLAPHFSFVGSCFDDGVGGGLVHPIWFMDDRASNSDELESGRLFFGHACCTVRVSCGRTRLMTDSGPLEFLFEEIDALHRAAGAPSYERIKTYANIDGRRISTSSMSNLAKRSTNPRLDTVLGFVAGCEGYARNKRIQIPARLCDHVRWAELVDAAARKRGGDADASSNSLLDVDENFLPPQAWGRIHQLISSLRVSIGEDDLRRLLWSAVDEIGPLRIDGPCEFLSLLHTLDTRFVPRGSPSPTLVLLEYFAATQHIAVCRRIQLLVDQLSASTGVAVSEVNRIRKLATAPFPEEDKDPASLFVKVDGSACPSYRLAAWLYRSDKPLTFKYEVGGSYDVSQLRTAVEDLISQLAPLARGLSLAQLQFEFALPWNLLGEAVEQWRLGDGRPIGALSPVVVRSADRMQDPWAAAQWQRRSGLLPRCDLDIDELVGIGTIEHGRYRLGEHTVCLAGHGPYSAPPSWQDEDPLLAAIKDGLPAALWHRNGGDRRELVDLIHKTVTDMGLLQLPTALQRVRSAQPTVGESALAMCLLWDDYYRQPEPFVSLSWPVPATGDRS